MAPANGEPSGTSFPRLGSAPASRRARAHARRPTSYDMLSARCNLAVCYSKLGRHEEALALRRDILAQSVLLRCAGDLICLHAHNLACSLLQLARYSEAKSFLLDQVPIARRALGAEHDLTLRLRCAYGRSLSEGDGVSRDELVEATTLLGELVRTTTRIYGKVNPLTVAFQRRLLHAQTKLRLLDVEAKLAAARRRSTSKR